jgi:hypothetical protein
MFARDARLDGAGLRDVERLAGQGHHGAASGEVTRDHRPELTGRARYEDAHAAATALTTSRCCASVSSL